MKLELIEGWEKFYKLWSVRLMAVGTVLAGWFLAAPDAAIQVWLMLPDDMRNALPPDVVKYIPIVILSMGTFARVVKQNKLAKAPENDTSQR